MLDKIQNSIPGISTKVALSRGIVALSGRIGHGGTTLPGRVVRVLDGDIAPRLGRKLDQGCVLVSATNGKTTTSAMIAAILKESGLVVARNREGANLAAGVATALLKNASLAGRPTADIGLFEVDEAVFPAIAGQLDPRAVLLMNLFRDQLDRYGELEHIADMWRDAVKKLDQRRTIAIVNADDPLVAEMSKLKRDAFLCFGIEDSTAGGLVMQHASDSKYCTVCGTPFKYEVLFMGHLGKYHCPNCGNRRPSPTIFAENVHLDGMRGSSFDLVTPDWRQAVAVALPGLYNVYNALGAAACCFGLKVAPDQIKNGLKSFGAAFGRVERLIIGEKKVCLLLVKNPAGFNEVVRTLLIEPGQKNLLLALNDKIADGRDISWIWDVDLEALAGEVLSATCSGTRAAEMAMRLKYAGLNAKTLKVRPDLKTALRVALAHTKDDETLYVLPTYTAMLALRQTIHKHFQTENEMADLVWK